MLIATWRWILAVPSSLSFFAPESLFSATVARLDVTLSSVAGFVCALPGRLLTRNGLAGFYDQLVPSLGECTVATAARLSNVQCPEWEIETCAKLLSEFTRPFVFNETATFSRVLYPRVHFVTIISSISTDNCKQLEKLVKKKSFRTFMRKLLLDFCYYSIS